MPQSFEQDLFKHLAYDALLTGLNQTALVSITDRKGIITYANDKFVKVSKYTQEELIGQNHRILKSGDQLDSLFVELWKTISKGKVWRGEIKNKAKDGSYYWVDTSIAPVMGNDGKPQQYIAVRFDITPQKQAESEREIQRQNLHDAKQQAETILESIGDALLTTDEDLNITMVNHVFEKLSGLSLKDVKGKPALKILPLTDENGHKVKNKDRPFRIAIKEKRTYMIPSSKGYHYDFTKGRLPVAISISPLVRNDEAMGIVAVFRDVSQEKQIDRAKSEFVSLASHQLRTPLTAVSWYTDIVLAGDTESIPEDQLKYIQEIRDSNQRMIDLVNALLNVSRIELGTFVIEPVLSNIVTICKQVVLENEHNIFERKIKFIEQYGKMPKMNIDPNLTRIIFENVISNAIKYTPNEGTVTVSIYKRNDMAVITVKDSGYGIPKEQQDKIFTKLFRADNIIKYETEGTGLGLYIAKAIVDASQGSITFTSAVNKGTTFTIELPLRGMEERRGSRRLD